eukprot:TRINITY_DN4829_c0_g1_i1.p3 TRINITY_DN4829_c0_g1~~TRINITY_DN4829_c0_g1_i1.p3  ORF type:complete len:126 (+),score=27.99 TRINITY_DN4829_c0_g1_i1:643-1020(+)
MSRRRLHQLAQASISCLIVSLIYLVRAGIRANHGDRDSDSDALAGANPRHVVLAGVVLAAKYLEDAPFSNCFFAAVGDVPVTELNALERALLRALHSDLYVGDELFTAYRGAVLCPLDATAPGGA